MGYGRQRVWGTIGWGITAFLAGYTVDLWSNGEIYKTYTPAFILVFAFTCFDLICCKKLEVSHVLESGENKARRILFSYTCVCTFFSFFSIFLTAESYVRIGKHNERCICTFEIKVHRNISMFRYSRWYLRQLPDLLFVLVKFSFIFNNVIIFSSVAINRVWYQ